MVDVVQQPSWGQEWFSWMDSQPCPGMLSSCQAVLLLLRDSCISIVTLAWPPAGFHLQHATAVLPRLAPLFFGFEEIQSSSSCWPPDVYEICCLFEVLDCDSSMLATEAHKTGNFALQEILSRPFMSNRFEKDFC